jgi:hypothetical protein
VVQQVLRVGSGRFTRIRSAMDVARQAEQGVVPLREQADPAPTPECGCAA